MASLPNFAVVLLLWPILLCAKMQSATLFIRVADASDAIVPGAWITLECELAPTLRSQAGQDGVAVFGELPMAGCKMLVKADGFREASRDIRLQTVDTYFEVQLVPAQEKTEIVVFAGVSPGEEAGTAAAGTLQHQQIARIPILNPATGFTEILTRTTPGVAADANGFAHPLGEHADTSISLDGQPITDQQAKVFSNQIDPNVIQSLTAITGAPPAEFGDKTSLVVTLTTRSGIGQTLSGSLSSEYGSFGTVVESLGLAAGGKRWGNFFAVNTSRSGRFLDTPEFRPIHARGNSSSLFDRIDWNPGEKNLMHLNLWAGRSWFQTPNSYDSAVLGQDQRSQIRNANVAFGMSHIFTPDLLISFTPFYRRDISQYFPSNNLLADQPAALSQYRTLANTGFRVEGQYARKVHTFKVGSTYWHTLLQEDFAVGLSDPLYNAPCVNSEGDPVAAPAIRSPQRCPLAGLGENPGFLDRLLLYDLSRGGTLYRFHETANIAETAFYVQDEIRVGKLILNLGLRYDIYNGLSRGRQLQPRFGAGWRIPRSNTLLRASYARLYETPYNENLIFANDATKDVSATNPFSTDRSEPVRPGTRNQFNAGFEQQFGKRIRVDADYYWKFTKNAFDFDTLFNTPITFSVAWRKSKIDGLAVRVELLNVHGLTAYSVFGHVRSRFFTPETGGLIFNSVPGNGVFRIDHGEEFEQTTNIRYQSPLRFLKGRFQPWISGVWRFNSGLALPDTVPVYNDALALTADQQAQMGLHCGKDFATQTRPIRSCSEAEFGATRIRIPRLGTQNDDRNPVRVSPRNLFDLSVGEDRLAKVERLAVGIRFSVVNVTNKVALYNFLSTFSGTHFVAPRSYQAGLQLTF